MTQFDKKVLAQIDEIKLSDRIENMRQEFFSSKVQVCADRAHLATIAWKETEGQHLFLRRAAVFERICDHIPIKIRDGELIVGSQTPYARGASPMIDYSARQATDIVEGDLRTRGEQAIAQVGDMDWEILRDDAKYWLDRCPEAQIDKELKATGCKLDEWRIAGVCRALDKNEIPRVRLLDFPKIFKMGLRGIIEEIDAEIASLTYNQNGDAQKYLLLKAGRISLEAEIRYAKRHAKLALAMAAKEKDPQRKKELEKIADVCSWVPENPPRDFWEAVQCHRFIYLGQNLETGSRCHQAGRLDQYLWPYYKKDREEGKLSLELAVDLLANAQMKIAQMEAFHGFGQRDIAQGHFGTKLEVGGVDRQGNDATNELSYLILHVAGLVKTAEPAFYVRWHKDSPKEFIHKGIWANIQIGGGSPAFHNDHHSIDQLVKDGASIEDARDYYISGCSHPFPFGSTQWSSPERNGAKIFELVMYDGVDPKSGIQVGIHTGDPRTFTCIEDWYEAYKKQWDYINPMVVRWANQHKHLANAYYATPFHDVLHPDVIKKGIQIEAGGCRYHNTIGVARLRMFADVADSFIAIKHLVYEEKKLTVDEIIDACAHNFEGDEKYERIRDMLIAQPKYGNDIDECDQLYHDINKYAAETTRALKNPFGDRIRASWGGASLHIPFGRVAGALPSGRKAGTPLADGSISPAAGADTSGPSATIRSAGKSMDWSITCDAILNQKIPKNLLQTPEQYDKFWALTESFFTDYDGYQIQWNVEDAETYKAAKKDPDSYRSLIVRVGGYSAYFVEIDPDLQDEIIRRTEQYI